MHNRNADCEPRPLGCQCQLEAGDSPCQIHGEDEEGEPQASVKIRRERDGATARADKAHAALRAAEQRELEALAALDEALALIRTILDADCLQPHAFEKGDDDASVYQACQHLLRIHMQYLTRSLPAYGPSIHRSKAQAPPGPSERG